MNWNKKISMDEKENDQEYNVRKKNENEASCVTSATRNDPSKWMHKIEENMKKRDEAKYTYGYLEWYRQRWSQHFP